LLIGMFAILGSLAVLRFMTLFTDVSIFAVNLSVAGSGPGCGLLAARREPLP
jgi:hypothetical protein